MKGGMDPCSNIPTIVPENRPHNPRFRYLPATNKLRVYWVAVKQLKLSYHTGYVYNN